jgi:drug/metabolite transporter (DMT)-like permease
MTELFGIFLAATAAIIFGLTTVMQKYSLRKVEKFSIGMLLKNKIWVSSLIVGMIGMGFYLFALSLTQVSSVQSIITSSAIIPVLAGSVLFKEKLGARRWFSIALILVGIATIIL